MARKSTSELMQMETNINKQRKRFLIASILVATTAYLIYDYYTNPCSIYNDYFLVHQKVIDRKYIYHFDKHNNIEKAIGTSDCDKLFILENYYKGLDSKIPIDYIFYDFEINFKYEILKFNYKDSIAFVKIYNTSPRMVKEVYKIVSMKCLHDTLPRGYTEVSE